MNTVALTTSHVILILSPGGCGRRYPLDLIKGNLIARTIIALGRARAPLRALFDLVFNGGV